MLRVILIFAPIILIDQLTKYFVRNFIALGGQIDVLPFLNFVNVKNTGIAFGMFQGFNQLLSVVSAIVLAVIAFWFIFEARNERKLFSVSFALVLAGGVSNYFDRAYFGFVTDFADFHFFGYHWYSFNIADACICVGAILLTYYYLFIKKPAVKA